MNSSEICPSWKATGVCKYGLDCRFLHEPDEATPLDVNEGDLKENRDDRSSFVISAGSAVSEEAPEDPLIKHYSNYQFRDEAERGKSVFPPPFTTHSTLYSLLKGHTGEFIDPKSGFTYNPKTKLYTSPSAEKYTYDASGTQAGYGLEGQARHWLRYHDNSSKDSESFSSKGTYFHDGTDEGGLSEVRAQVSMSLTGATKKRKKGPGDGFLTAAPLGPKVQPKYEPVLVVDLPSDVDTGGGDIAEASGTSQFQAFFEAEDAAREGLSEVVKQDTKQKETRTAVETETEADVELEKFTSVAYVDRASARRRENASHLFDYERPHSHDPLVQAVAEKILKDEAIKKAKPKALEHDANNKGNSMLRKMGWKGAGTGLGKTESGIKSSAVVTKVAKSSSQSSNSAKGLGSTKKRAGKDRDEKRPKKKPRYKESYKQHGNAITMSRYQALSK